MPQASEIRQEITLLIPAYNAESSLGDVLDEVLALGLPALVVNDGSTDGTQRVAQGKPVWRVVSHERNRGKGAALKTGFSVARDGGFSHVLTLDADGQHPVEAIPRFLEAYRNRPQAILVGNRFSGETIQEMPLVRRLSNGCSSTLISLAAKTRIPDAQCGMRVYPLDLFERIELRSDGYALESEVLVKAARMGIEVVNLPISCHYPDGTATSRYRAFVDSWRIAKVVLKSIRESK
ncbi:MAG: glycosyltransferase family 2 protein [Candidatus Omnitrophica bacterium]|nr:Undecaprenyl-phosphate mannosyltransferase [bacterium]NUN95036.1 glycosyltransferase family 2 protein [Candidatus Omnitrophota bacterium]